MLIGLGLGPGDKELLTLRAVKLLKEADAVFVPGRIAHDLISEIREATILEFPMTNDEEVIRQALERNADRMAAVASNGTAVLGIIGDPSFYSTFSRQCEVVATKYPKVEFSVEPGISSITAFACRANLSIHGGFVVTDGADPESLVLLKVKKPRKKVEELKKEGYTRFVLAERVFMEGERVYEGDEIPESSDYFSIMYARK